MLHGLGFIGHDVLLPCTRRPGRATRRLSAGSGSVRGVERRLFVSETAFQRMRGPAVCLTDRACVTDGTRHQKDIVFGAFLRLKSRRLHDLLCRCHRLIRLWPGRFRLRRGRGCAVGSGQIRGGKDRRDRHHGCDHGSFHIAPLCFELIRYAASPRGTHNAGPLQYNAGTGKCKFGETVFSPPCRTDRAYSRKHPSA